MQSVYWFCLIIGGVFVAIASLGGPDELAFDADADFNLEATLDADGEANLVVDADYEIDTDVALDHQPHRYPLRRRQRLPLGVLTSFKFWTFGGCFFGLTGLVLQWIQPSWSATVIFTCALSMGILLGGSLALALRTLHRRQVDSLVRTEDFVGLLGTVELPFDANSKGKVCLEVRGSTLHLIAYTTDNAKSFVPGDPVLVVGADNSRLWVVSPDTAFSSR